MSGGKRMSKQAAKAGPTMDVAVGQRIRDLRRTRAMSLETVAVRADLSIGFLSQIERGLSSPSLRVLATLADVLGVGIAGLFGAGENTSAVPDAVVTRERQRPELNLWRTGISKQLLSPAGSDGRLNLFLRWFRSKKEVESYGRDQGSGNSCNINYELGPQQNRGCEHKSHQDREAKSGLNCTTSLSHVLSVT